MEVSVITCTMRDHYMENVIENFSRQVWKEKELIIILNCDEIDINKWKVRTKDEDQITVVQLPQNTTLGNCLNEAVSRAKYPYVAKFDDDDYYAPFYLTQSLKAFRKTNAAIVGKRTVYTYFEDSSLLGIHRPNFENKYVRNVRGATLMFQKSLFPQIHFPNINRGEDGSFLIQSVKKGKKIYSTGKDNFVCIRRADLSSHSEPNHRLIKGCKNLTFTKDFKSIIAKDE
ncbi:glycosyl transferase family 2 [Salipaludibacillus keqinensis]|uniref:Glycosyl transferase family 2 n=1 Tax=Salipaludibacillus keqinensis TaxID=2045207 RepID=A0A323TVE7_9BACI|nr:glycosyltransferase [Salipaludibacillus keqinensis]PYZ93485.1 glycosyl transferase family 2 [Salipaludibacillus keqinensis]